EPAPRFQDCPERSTARREDLPGGAPNTRRAPGLLRRQPAVSRFLCVPECFARAVGGALGNIGQLPSQLTGFRRVVAAGRCHIISKRTITRFGTAEDVFSPYNSVVFPGTNPPLQLGRADGMHRVSEREGT